MSHKIALVSNYYKDNFYSLVNNKFNNWVEYGGIERINRHLDKNMFSTATCYISSYVTNFCINDFGESISTPRLIAKSCQDLKNHLGNTYFDWTHFAYVNTLMNLDFKSCLSTVKSCDISKFTRHDIPKDLIFDNIDACDYVFMSNESPIHWKDIIQNNKGKSQTIILHEKYGSFALNQSGTEIAKCGNVASDFKITVGAGDIFAGAFLAERIINSNLLACMNFAHERTREYLEKKNEKI